MLITNIFELTAEFIKTGNFPIHQPRDSDWKITGWGKSMFTIDIADIATAGAAAVAPVNVNVGAGTTEVAFYKPSANLSFKINGYGGSFGVSAGWGIPFAGGEKGGKALSKAGETIQGNALSSSAGASSSAMRFPSGGIGTLLAGCKAQSVISPREIAGYMTLIGGDLNSGPIGLGCALVIFADRPITEPSELLFAQAYGIVADIHLSTSVAAGINYCVFKTQVDMKSLPCAGALYGMSIPK